MGDTKFDSRSYWDKRLKRDWTLHGVGMLRLAHSFNVWQYRVRDRVFRRTVRRARIDVPRSAVLDIGPGTGFYINAWTTLGARSVNGLDIADSAVAQLREKFPDATFDRADISDGAPFDDGAFDVVSAFDVLFHIVDDDRYEKAMTEVHRVLAPGGRFIFSENFVPERRVGRKHYVSRSREEIEALLHAAGFEIAYHRPMFVFMVPPVASASRWRWYLWSKRILPLAKRELRGKYLGAVMFPFEVALTAVLRKSPVMEIVVCRKRQPEG
ncbi:methyltransferase family protein [Murinocardiopsis flavida]|uniref:Methyltransferase family protein n=1 Tax=Murinocardiopsis flavida TaxID=645275 RepID=A0A2P8CWR9_9ACTN|nr:class I SAM-dependent methyltransferase [Murinocardiopsis flavida]PSK89422.1 methyltransferase family protein [Murinocardiopsis flavida]